MQSSYPLKSIAQTMTAKKKKDVKNIKVSAMSKNYKIVYPKTKINF